jgi:hypothetical protein
LRRELLLAPETVLLSEDHISTELFTHLRYATELLLLLRPLIVFNRINLVYIYDDFVLPYVHFVGHKLEIFTLSKYFAIFESETTFHT